MNTINDHDEQESKLWSQTRRGPTALPTSPLHLLAVKKISFGQCCLSLCDLLLTSPDCLLEGQRGFPTTETIFYPFLGALFLGDSIGDKNIHQESVNKCGPGLHSELYHLVTHKKKVDTPHLEVGTPMRLVSITGPSSPEEAELALVHQFLGYKGTHSIDDEQFTTDILACWAREEHDRTCKVFGLSPSSCRDSFRNLAQPCGVRQKFFVPEGQNDVRTKQATNRAQR